MSKLPTEWDLLNKIWHIINQQVEEEILLSSDVQDEIEKHIESHTQAHTEGLRKEISKLEKEAQDRIEFIPIYEGKIRQERCRADDAEKRVKELESLMQEFVDRVDRGEVRSKKTYAKFKEALK